MTDRGKLWAACIALFVAVLVIGLLFWNRRPNYEKDFHPEVVRNMEVLGNGDPLPAIMRSTDCYGLRIRFEVVAEPKTEPYSAYFMVVGPDGYAPESVDVIDTYRQKHDDKVKTQLRFSPVGGRAVDLTPKPPGMGDTSIQFCALLDVRSLMNCRKFFGKEDLEMHLWLYPTPPPPGSDKAVGGPGAWVYRHKFRVE